MRAVILSVAIVAASVGAITGASAQGVVIGDSATATLGNFFGTVEVTAYGGPLRISAAEGPVLGPNVCVHYNGIFGDFRGCGSAPVSFDPTLSTATLTGSFAAGPLGQATISLVWRATGDYTPIPDALEAIGVARAATATGSIVFSGFTLSGTDPNARLFRGVEVTL